MDTTTDELQLDYDKLQERFLSLQRELQVKNNKLSESKSQLALATEREKHYLSEIEILQTSEHPEVNKLQIKNEQLQGEYLYLERHLNSELSLHDEELCRLQSQLKCHVESIANNSDSFQASNDEISEDDLPLDKQVLRDEVREKQAVLDALEEKNAKLTQSGKELRLELERVEENIECKKQDLKEAYTLMNTVQEDMLKTKTELDSVKSKAVRVSDGNSLFAEVNDRRLELQETLINLKQKCNKMKEQISITQKQMYTLRLHNDELSNLLKNDPSECLQDYENLVTTYKDHISTLKNLSKAYRTLLLQRQKLVEKGLPNNVVEFVTSIITEKQKIEEKFNECANMEYRAQKMMSLQLRETNLKVQEWKKINEQLWDKLLELEDTVQNLQLENNSIAADIHKPAIEIIKNDEDHNDANKVYEGTKGILKAMDKQEEKLREEDDKENSMQEPNEVDEKKVKFTVDTVDPKPSNKHQLRKGGKILQHKTIHIPSIINKK